MSRIAAVCFVVLLGIASSLACTQSAPSTAAQTAAAPPAGPVTPPVTDADKIKSAMSAAPAAIADEATVIDMTSMATLKTGTNGWTCFPDMPATPGADPMCVDQNGMEWANAWMNHQDPPKGKIGFAYMLAGGSDASNTDPFATEPQPGAKWVDTGPHVMVLNIGDSFAGYPTTAANTKVPYVMFPGTPYAHLMIPVK